MKYLLISLFIMHWNKFLFWTGRFHFFPRFITKWLEPHTTREDQLLWEICH